MEPPSDDPTVKAPSAAAAVPQEGAAEVAAAPQAAAAEPRAQGGAGGANGVQEANHVAIEVHEATGRDVAGASPASETNGIESIDDRARKVLSQLTLEEKVSLLSGISMWESGGIPRLGIPPLRVTDGPHGARGLSLHGDVGVLLAPCSLAMGATFNDALVEEVGTVLGAETVRRGADVLLGPCLNLQRFPNSGRHFECFSEDPYLASRMGAAYVRGVQKHAVACAKHFVCNDQETDRGTVNSVVDERTLREVYLAPFHAAVEAGCGAMMCGYNRLNGTYCTENSWLLQQVLRDEWGYKGLVMSDWFGNQSTLPSLRAGLNVEMPGLEPRHFGGYLAEGVRAGRVPPELLDERCMPVLRALLRPNRGNRSRVDGESAQETRKKDEAVMIKASQEACVLLRNEESTLPMDVSRLKKVAIIGPNASKTVIQGGGSSRVHPKAAPSILEVLRSELTTAGVEVVHAQGCEWETLPRHMMNLEVNGLMSMGTCDASGQPITSLVLPTSAQFNDIALWLGSWLVSKEWFRILLMPALRSCGWRNSTPAEAAARAPARHPSLVRPPQPMGTAGDDALMKAAEKVAEEADACVVVVGTHGFWELEGVDQPHNRLLGRQDELVSRVVAKAKGPVIVVLNVGSPKELPWFDQVKAVLLAHFGGMGVASAVTNLLLGKTSPLGRLPTTWPKTLDEAAAVSATRGATRNAPGDVPYAEGLRLGYRASGPEPLLPFGHGLSYTHFSFRDFQVKQTMPCGEGGPRASASIVVRNDGQRAGAEVAQLYVEADDGIRCLRGFRHTDSLEPGAEERVGFELGPRDLGARFDAATKLWKQPVAGIRLVVNIGASSADRKHTAELVLA